MKAVIMAGGKGTRFWPKSTEALPKQFLSLTSEHTLLQESYGRLAERLPAEDIYVVTAQKYEALVKEQLPKLSQSRLIIEPEQRDTAPCVALAALHFLNQGEDEPMVMIPSDQYIADSDMFLNAVEAAARLAEEDEVIVTLGIVPTRPETGYGYIRTETAQTADAPGPSRLHRKVAAFIEKPQRENAEQLILQSNVYWNSGIFAWKPSTVLGYLRRFEPQMWELLIKHRNDPASIYPQLRRISVDYAILERAETIYCIPVSFKWDDVGTWTALERIFEKDAQGNQTQGEAHLVRARDNIVFVEGNEALIIGAEGLIIVSTPEGLLVCSKDEEQAIKEALQQLQQRYRERNESGG